MTNIKYYVLWLREIPRVAFVRGNSRSKSYEASTTLSRITPWLLFPFLTLLATLIFQAATFIPSSCLALSFLNRILVFLCGATVLRINSVCLAFIFFCKAVYPTVLPNCTQAGCFYLSKELSICPSFKPFPLSL